MGVSVRHNSRLAAIVALAAAVMTVAWFSRALQSGSVMDWLWCVVVATVGVVQLLVVRDGRAPLLVADDQGVRVRRGETWSGLRWQDIEHVEVQSPASWLRDGQIVVHPRVIPAEEALLRESRAQDGDTGDDLTVDRSAGPASQALEAYVVPLGRTTRVEFDGLTGDLVGDLDALASGQAPVLVLTRIEEPAEKPARAEKPEKVRGERGRWVGMLGRSEAERRDLDDTGTDDTRSHDTGSHDTGSHDAGSVDGPGADRESEPEPGTAEVLEQPDDENCDESGPEFAPVRPSRATVPAARSEVLRDSVRSLPKQPPIPFQRNGDAPVLLARVDDSSISESREVRDAVIGPLIAAARHRARLSIDTLSERTRIRPHVLECIEVDDFEACGGDFYARGHLRTLARIFGLDAQQLVDLYDDHYARAEIEARQVFEAELATGIGGGVRVAHTGPRWSLLAACVLALAGVWGVARVFNDTPQELVSPAPNVVDTAGLANGDTPKAPAMTLATLEVTAAGSSPQVVVRDKDGRILWAGKLTDGQHQQVVGLAPFDVTASNGSAVKVSFLGKAKGTVGGSGAAGSKQFG
jgi:hypothetical protein